MITITTKEGIIELAHIEPDDAETIKGNCDHGVSLFDRCFDCIYDDSLERYEEFRRKDAR